MSPELIKFIQENRDLINENSKKSWEEIYNRIPYEIMGKFTKVILDSGINDPASKIGSIPQNYLYKSNIATYKIPNNVTSIGEDAFFGCSSLTSVVIPDSVASIGPSAFYSCDSLTSVEIPDSVTSIGFLAFRDCSSLTSVIIGNSVTSIGDWAFSYCDSLMSVEIPDSVTSIGSWVFYYCENLKEVQYKGTKKQAIELGIGDRAKKNWREGSSIEKIICTDGVIKL